MDQQQTTAQTEHSRQHRIGVARRLDIILAEIEDLRGAVQQVLAERKSAPQKEQNR